MLSFETFYFNAYHYVKTSPHTNSPVHEGAQEPTAGSFYSQ